MTNSLARSWPQRKLDTPEILKPAAAPCVVIPNWHSFLQAPQTREPLAFEETLPALAARSCLMYFDLVIVQPCG